MSVRDNAQNLSMKCVITCCLVRVYHAIQGAVKNEYRVVAERRLAGRSQRNSVETPLHHHTVVYYTKSHELCHTLNQARIYHETNEAYTSRPFTCMVSFYGTSGGPSNILEMNWNLAAHTWEKFVEILLNLTILKIYITKLTLPITSC